MVLLSTAVICNNMMMRMMMMMTMISCCYYYRYPKLISQIPNWVVLLFFLLFISPQNTQTPTPKEVSPAETDPPSGNAKPIKLSITQLSKKITLNHKELLTPQHILHQQLHQITTQNKQTKTRRPSENQIFLQCHKPLEKSQEISYNNSTRAQTSSILRKKPIENPLD